VGKNPEQLSIFACDHGSAGANTRHFFEHVAYRRVG
jgi:hypothetical protein